MKYLSNEIKDVIAQWTDNEKLKAYQDMISFLNKPNSDASKVEEAKELRDYLKSLLIHKPLTIQFV